MESSILKKPLISIITPTYNRATSLPRALESIFDQTFKNWEIIIIDDGSTDTTQEILKKFQEQNKNVICIKHDKNKGVTAARNTGLHEAKGDYIAFLDSDDVWLPQKLEKQLEVFNRSPDIGLVYTGALFINEKGGEQRIKNATVEGYIYEQEIAFNPIGSPSRVMVKREVFEKVGMFDENFSVLEDWEMWIRITKTYPVRSINEPLIHYFESADSMSINTEKLISGYKNLWNKIDLVSLSASIQAEHYLRLGHRLCYYGATQEGRSYIWKAVKIQPTRFKIIFIWMLSALPENIYRWTTFQLMKNAK